MHKSRFVSFAVASGVVLAMAAAAILAPRAKVNAATGDSVNWNTTYQTMDGFGGQTWVYADTLSPGEADCFFSASNGSCPTGTSIGLEYVRTANTPDGSIPDLTTLQEAVARGAQVELGLQSPPASMKVSGSFDDGDGGIITSDYGAYATYIVNYIKTFQGDGVPIAVLDVQNEPNIDESSLGASIWSQSQFDTFIGSYLGPALANAGLHPRVMLGSESSWFADNYPGPCLSDANCAQYVSIAAGHGYGYPYTPTPYPQATQTGKDIWLSETGEEDPTWDPSISDALTWANNIHQFLTVANTSALEWWELAYTSSAGNFGLTDQNFNPAKRFYAEGNWSKFVRSGWVRVDANANPTSGVDVTAFKNPNTGAFAIVAINNNGGSSAMNFSFNGFTAGSVTPWETSASDNLQEGGAVNAGSGFSYTLDAQSVTTFVGTSGSIGGGSTPPPPPTADTTPPSVPTNVQASAYSTNSIGVTWNASTDSVGVTGYKVYRAGSLLGTTPNTGWLDTNLSAGTSYSYTVVAYDAAGNVSSQSSAVSATTESVASDTTPPSVPTGLQASAVSQTEINLSWNASTDNVGVTGYKVYRNTTQIASTQGTSYSDSAINPGTAYSYTVSAYDAAGNVSNQSSAASATTASVPSTPPPSTPPPATSGTTITAASSNESDVAAAVAKASNGDTVAIPCSPASVTWTSTLNVNYNITLTALGATPNTSPSTFGAGTNCLTILDDDTNGSLFNFTPTYASSNDLAVLQDINIDPLNASTHIGSWPVNVVGTCASSGCPYFREDNIYFGKSQFWSYSNNGPGTLNVMNDVFGVADHNTTPNGTYDEVWNINFPSYLGVGQYGDNSWAQPDSFGTANNFFIENNSLYNSQAVTEGEFPSVAADEGGSRQVDRFNQIVSDGSQGTFGWHGLDTSGRTQAGREMEVYGNTVECAASSCNILAGFRDGTGLVFGNTLSAAAGGWFNGFAFAADYRSVYTNTGGWGACGDAASGLAEGPYDTNDGVTYYSGTASAGSSGLTLVDTTKDWTTNQLTPTGAPYSVWDITKNFVAEIASNNADSITIQSGVPEQTNAFSPGDSYAVRRSTVCVDQPGRGQGNYVSNWPASPVGPINQALDPIYEWNDTYKSTSMGYGNIGSDTGMVIANRDYYTDNSYDNNSGLGPHAQTSPTSPFNGSTACNYGAGSYSCGVGFGTLANRPTSCTAGVGYWATDQGNWNTSNNGFGQGELFKCTATNTWTLGYTPYPYPNPLITGNYTTGTTPPPTGSAPLITSAPGASGTAGSLFSYQITASNNPTSYSASGLPSGLTVNDRGLITGTPVAGGTYSVTLSAWNSYGVGSASLTVTVQAVATPPVTPPPATPPPTTPPPPTSGITLVQATDSTGEQSSATYPSIGKTFVNSVTPGDAVIVAVEYGMAHDVVTGCTDSEGDAYTEATHGFDTAESLGTDIWYATNVKGGTDDVICTFSTPTAWNDLALQEYSGIASANALDVVSSNNTGSTLSTNWTTGSVSTHAAGELVFAAFQGNNKSQTLTPGPGFTKAVDDGAAGNFTTESMVESTAGTIAATASSPVPDIQSNAMATFYPATATPTTPPPPPLSSTVISLVQEIDNTQESNATNYHSIGAIFSNPVITGDTIVLAVEYGATTDDVSSCTDNQGDTFHEAAAGNDVSESLGTDIFYALNARGGTTSVSCTFENAISWDDLALQEYSGVGGLDAWSTANSENTASASWTTGSVTTRLPGELLFAAFQGNDKKTPLTPGAGFVKIVDDSEIANFTTMESIHLAPGTVAATANSSVADSQSNAMAAFYPTGESLTTTVTNPTQPSSGSGTTPPPPATSSGSGSSSNSSGSTGSGSSSTTPPPTTGTTTPPPTTGSGSVPSTPSSTKTITVTGWLNVRTTPSTAGHKITTVPTGTHGTVVSGPVTNAGYTWYEVSYVNGTTGWSVANNLNFGTPASSGSSSTNSSGLTNAQIESLIQTLYAEVQMLVAELAAMEK